MKKNRLISLLLCLCMVLTFFTGLVSTANADDGNVISYTVENGDYLFKICRNLGIDYYQCKQAIMILNGFTTEIQLNRISVGQTIKLPASNAVASTVKGTTTTTTTVSTTTTVGGTTTTTTSTSTVSGNLAGYTVAYYLVPHAVASGETLNSICNALGTSYEQYASVILGVNGIKRANALQAGQTVLIPTTKAPTSGNCYAVVSHSVRSGENLTGICSAYGINYQNNKTLVNGLNPNTNLNKIFAGQTINVPILTAATATAVTTGSGAAVSVATPTVASTGYQISIDPADNGSPFAVVGAASYATRAEAGASVVIRPNAKTGYGVKAIKVVRTDSGAAVPVTNNSFTMPESNVKVTVTYAQGKSIRKMPSQNGTFDALVYGTAATSAFYGDEVVLSPAPKTGYSVKTVFYREKDATSGDVKADYDEATGIYSFKMPNKNIDLYVEFEQTKTCKLTYTRTGSGVVQYSVNGNVVTEVPKNTTVTISFIPSPGWIFDVDSFTKIDINGTTWTKASLMGSGMLKKIDDSTYTFFVDVNGELKIDVIFNDYNAYTISTAAHSLGSVAFAVTDHLTGVVRKGVNWARPKDIVEIIPFPNNTDPSSNKQIVYWPTDSTYTRDGKSVTAEGTVSYLVNAQTGAKLNKWVTGSEGYKFIMPDANVWLRPQFVEQDASTVNLYYRIDAYDSEFGSILAQDSSGNAISVAKAGDTVKAVIKPVENYVVDKVYYIDSTLNWTEISSPYTFTMPANNTVIKVDYRVKYDLVQVVATNDDPDGINQGVEQSPYWGEYVVMLVNGQRVEYLDELAAGMTVTLSYTLKAGKKLDRVDKTGGSGSQKLEPDANGNYSYTITKADTSGSPPVTFTVKTVNIEVPKYKVLYSPFGVVTVDALGVETTTYFDMYTLNGSSAEYEAKEGEEITMAILTSSIPSGYKIKQVIIDGKDEYVNGKDTYTFIMPARDVATQVTLEKIEVAP